MKLLKLAEILKIFAETGIVNSESDVFIDVPDKGVLLKKKLIYPVSAFLLIIAYT